MESFYKLKDEYNKKIEKQKEVFENEFKNLEYKYFLKLEKLLNKIKELNANNDITNNIFKEFISEKNLTKDFQNFERNKFFNIQKSINNDLEL